MREQTFEGTYYEIGQQRGTTLRDLPVPKVGPEEVAFARRCRAMVEGIHPPAVEEFEGMLDTGGFDPDDFAAYFFAREKGILRGCTMFAALPSITRDGAAMVGRNYDWISSDLKWCEVRRVHPKGGQPTLSYTHHWAGSTDVLNASGLCVTMASLPPRTPVRPGLQWNLVIGIMMDRCRDVREALAFIEGVSHIRSMSYLLVDASGDAAVVEATPEHVHVRRPERGYIVATNHEVADQDIETASARSLSRYGCVARMLESGLGCVGEDLVKDILRNHECHVCSGVHGDHGRDGEWGTIWSLICRPHALDLRIAPGHPCEVPYEQVGWKEIRASYSVR